MCVVFARRSSKTLPTSIRLLKSLSDSSTISACMIFPTRISKQEKEISVVLKNLLPRDLVALENIINLCVSRHGTARTFFFGVSHSHLTLVDSPVFTCKSLSDTPKQNKIFLGTKDGSSKVHCARCCEYK